MTMKSVLLGAAAGIAAIGAAQAADLPMTKGEAVEYVKVCSAFGEGFFYIPGTDTCLKIGGEIRAKYYAFGGTGYNRNDNRSAFDTQARVWFDARTETDWGLLRSYFQINADSNRLVGRGGGDGARNDFTIDKAFIQFGGLTAGYAHSFFGFYDNEYGDTLEGNYYAQTKTVNLLAYTAQFGGGFSATLALEDGRDHRVGSGPSTPVDINGTLYGYRDGGQQVPDVVAQLRWDQSWGSLAVQAAGHQSRSGTGYSVDTNDDGIADTDVVVRRSNKYGYAVGATGLIKIPAIDGWFVVEGQYADGALDYLGAGNTFVSQSDRFVNAAGRVDAGKGWSITGELGGRITPQLQAVLVGSYIDTTYDRYSDLGDLGIKEFTISGNLTYTIVKGLKVAGEVGYTHGKVDHRVVDPVPGHNDYDNWLAGMRITRQF
ncbi:porin [Labrys sp. LIt4]|uniref:porin n=1 Tax=Labrys sp. LIt4 TaxID=2821355 RepID=UPI001ADF9572|nr:porin [Labrys sp. LIt4]MBP0578607.1 porin [Labrys sp. LIt4]